jgi:hypothetical protein
VIEPPHHRQPPQRIASEQANHRLRKPSTTFATKSALSGGSQGGEFTSAFGGVAEVHGRTASAASTRMPSRPGGFHPEPLTDPDLTLSRHPARATARRLPPSIEYRVPPVLPMSSSTPRRACIGPANNKRQRAVGRAPMSAPFLLCCSPCGGMSVAGES